MLPAATPSAPRRACTVLPARAVASLRGGGSRPDHAAGSPHIGGVRPGTSRSQRVPENVPGEHVIPWRAPHGTLDSTADDVARGESRIERAAPQILFVCTANQCRSPVAKSAFVHALSTGGLRAVVRAAGFLEGGFPVPPEGLATAALYGLDLRGHTSRQLVPMEVEGADLIITMTREHSRELVVRFPRAWPRTFTLRQLARWLDDQYVPRHASLGDWLDAYGDVRPRTVLVGSSDEDDVEDPMGRREAVWQPIVDMILRDIAHVAERLAPLLR